jgi:hypothetical protein
MSGRGPQTFKKRQKEQLRKERQQVKLEKKLQRRREGPEKSDQPQEQEEIQPGPQNVPDTRFEAS